MRRTPSGKLLKSGDFNFGSGGSTHQPRGGADPKGRKVRSIFNPPLLLAVRSGESGNEPRGPLKGNHKGWFVKKISGHSLIPVEPPASLSFARARFNRQQSRLLSFLTQVLDRPCK